MWAGLGPEHICVHGAPMERSLGVFYGPDKQASFFFRGTSLLFISIVVLGTKRWMNSKTLIGLCIIIFSKIIILDEIYTRQTSLLFSILVVGMKRWMNETRTDENGSRVQRRMAATGHCRGDRITAREHLWTMASFIDTTNKRNTHTPVKTNVLNRGLRCLAVYL
jgi:hypothetical protein